MKVVIIGTGNAAHVLARKIEQTNHQLLQVVGRDPINTEKMARILGVEFTNTVSHIRQHADIYIVAIADDALTSINGWLQLERRLVVHTAGSVSKHVLKGVSKNYGVLYPLQSLKAGVEVLPEIPFLVDGNTADDLALIKDFASDLSDRVVVADDEARLKMHVAAVFVNNFSNHLYALAERYCKTEHLSFDLLLPLIQETANRLSTISPADAQTGPAVRGDQSTIQKQMEILNAHPQLQNIYEAMTESIETFFGLQS